ncbi:extended synaptotagmin-2-like isoform X1, partial [Brachionus plicatilis]
MFPENEVHLPQSKFGLGSDHSDMIVVLIRFFRISAVVFLAWLIGYFNFSYSWVLLCVFLYLLRERNSSARQTKAEVIKALGINERDAVLARLDEVPAWVYFPDKERVEWLNKILKIIWPHLRLYATTTLVNVIEPIINQYSTNFIGSVKFKEIDLGDIPPRITSIKVYTENVPPGEVLFDCEIMYAGDANIMLSARNFQAGVKDIQFHGSLRVILKPLCNRIPFFAAATAFFLNKPQVDFNLTNIANAFDLPGLRNLIDNIIEDSIAKTLVLPNRLVIPIIPDLKLDELDDMKKVRPKGVLRINVVKGINLKKADMGVFGAGKSDPYVKITGLGLPKRTKTISDSTDPIWNETFDFMLEDDLIQTPDILIQCFDSDEMNDDFLGSVEINVENIISKGIEEGIYKLKGVSRGELILRLEWFTVSTESQKLNEILRVKSLNQQQASCILLVDLKSALDLPMVLKKSGVSEPSPRAIFSINDNSQESTTLDKTTHPKWNQNFCFFVENPQNEFLMCKINDEKSKKTIANLQISLKDLLIEENLELSRVFDLRTLINDYNPKLSLNLRLYILCPGFRPEPERQKIQAEKSASLDKSLSGYSQENILTK